MFNFDILYTKPHNKHYLDRYVRFIKHCQTRKTTSDYLERHHIAPKAKDLFPELVDDPTNIVILTGREHLIAHVILWKAYKGSQSHALWYMLDFYNSDTNDRLSGRKVPSSLRIRYAAKVRQESIDQHRGMTNYKDSEDNRYYLHRDDPLIEELGLVGIRAGELMTNEQKEKMSGQRVWVLYDNKNRRVIKLSGKHSEEHLEYIRKGWSTTQCPEWAQEETEERVREVRRRVSQKLKGKVNMYYPSGAYYGKIDKDDPIIAKLGLYYKQTENHIRQQKERISLATEAKLGTNIWNNGQEEKFCRECPGIGWVKGRLPRNTEWEEKRKKALSERNGGSTTWNDGVRNYRVKRGDKPQPHWVPGMVPRKKT